MLEPAPAITPVPANAAKSTLPDRLFRLCVGIACIALSVQAGLYISRTWVRAAPPESPVSERVAPGVFTTIEGAAASGSPTAKAVLIEFSDFECPFCKAHALGKAYEQFHDAFVTPGLVRYVFRHKPGRQHVNAAGAAAAAVCADAQGAFAEMKKALFSGPSPTSSIVLSHAALLNVSREKFASCLTIEGPAQVDRDRREGTRLGVTGTPTFLLGTPDQDGRVQIRVRLVGQRSFEELAEAVRMVSRP